MLVHLFFNVRICNYMLNGHRVDMCFPRQVNSGGPSVTVLIYDFSEQGGKIFCKSRTEKLEKQVVFWEEIS